MSRQQRRNAEQNAAKVQEMNQRLLQAAMEKGADYQPKQCDGQVKGSDGMMHPCPSTRFADVFIIKIIPKLLLGAPADVRIQFPMTVCCTCGKPFSDTTPSAPVVKLAKEGKADG